MKNLIRLEELTMFVFSFLGFLFLGFSWYLFFVFLLLPDISILAYIFGNKIGAVVYNIFHHKTTAIILIVLGVILHVDILSQLGIVFIAHLSSDRALSLGLKYFDDFKHTHLS